MGVGGGGEDIYKKGKKDRFRFITPAESETRTSFFFSPRYKKKKDFGNGETTTGPTRRRRRCDSVVVVLLDGKKLENLAWLRRRR